MPYVPPGAESLKEDGWWNAPSSIIEPTVDGPHHDNNGMPTVGPGPSTIGELWQFPEDNGTTPLEELGPAGPASPGGGGGGGAVEFPEEHISPGGPGMLERAGNWFTDLF